VSWALEVNEIEAVAERLDLPVRLSPSGRFSTVGLDQSFETRYLPFFITWTDAKPAPVNDLVVHTIDLEGDLERLRDWVMYPCDDLDVNIAEGQGAFIGVRVLGSESDIAGSVTIANLHHEP
jgi:hypothetical protein